MDNRPCLNGRRRCSNVLFELDPFRPLWTSRECSFRLTCDCSHSASLPLVTERWKRYVRDKYGEDMWKVLERERRPFYSLGDRSSSSWTKTDYDGAVLCPGWTENEIAPESVYIISSHALLTHVMSSDNGWNVE